MTVNEAIVEVSAGDPDLEDLLRKKFRCYPEGVSPKNRKKFVVAGIVGVVIVAVVVGFVFVAPHLWVRKKTDPENGKKSPAPVEQDKFSALIEQYHGKAIPDDEGSLTLEFSRVNDAGFLEILAARGDRKIHGLNLNESTVTDRSLSEIAKIKTIEYLYLQRTRVTAAGIQAVGGLPLLELQFHNRPLGDDALAKLSPTLEGLMLDDTQVTNKGMKLVAKLKNLRRLYLTSTLVTDDGVRYFTDSPLSDLDLTQTGVSDTCISLLPTTLTRLDLDVTGVTDAGLREIPRLKNLRILRLSHTTISDTGVRHLLSLEKLVEIELEGCPNVTEEGISLLKSQFGERLTIKE